MPNERGDSPFIDSDSREGFADALTRILETVAPDSLVAGGPTDGDPLSDLQRHPRNYEELKKREAIYQSGGPITDFIDTRALMTYGTGVEFTTDEEDVKEIIDGQIMTVADWLHHAFPLIDHVMIERGVHTYVFGDAWPEVVTTRGGGVSHINLIHPTTVDPRWDAHGELTQLRQIVERPNGRPLIEPLDMDAVGHWFYKNNTAGPLGDSLLAQNQQEIEWYLANQEQRANAIRLHGSPKYHVKAGSEGQTIADKLLRRIRNRFRSADTDESTNWVTGGDIEISELDTPGFEGMNNITETDVMKLSSGFGVPIEWTNFGSAGLGTGKPADSRIQMFENQARAEQRRAVEQLKEWPLRFVVDELSPFPPGTRFDVEFGEVRSQNAATAEWVSQIADHLTREEIRNEFGYPPLSDEDAEELPPREDTGGGLEGGAGLFTARDDPGDDAPDPLDSATKRMHTDGGDTDFRRALEDLDEDELPEDFGECVLYVQDETGMDEESAEYVCGHMRDPNKVGEVETPGDERAMSRALLHAEADADALTQEELVWQDVYERVLWSEDTGRSLFEFDPEEVPDFVVTRLQEAIAAGALFDDFETVPASAASAIGDVLLDSLEKRHGWSIDSIAKNLQDEVPSLSYDEAERIGRTETQALVNDAREQGYADEFDLSEETFDWVGPDDSRTTEACEWIKSQIPEEGVSLERIRELVAEAPAHDDHVDTEPRRYTPHINCRHTFSRQV